MHHAFRAAFPLTAALLLPGTAFAQDASAEDIAAALAEYDGSAVIATVDDVDITFADAAIVFEALPAQAATASSEQILTGITEQLVSETALFKAAIDAGLHETPEMKRRLAAVRRSALAEAYLTEQLDETITDEFVRNRYEEAIAEFAGGAEIRARHILVKTEDEAKEVVAELEDGADFAELAAEKSTGPSGASGGDLGFFGRGQRVAPFSEAAFGLEEPGDISAPVETQFGWHVIKLEEKRTQAPPPFEAVAPQIREVEAREVAETIIEDARGAYEIEISEEAPPAFLIRQPEIYQE